MSASSQVSYRAFLLRLRFLAKKALQEYGLGKAELKFKSFSGNGLYQVTIGKCKRPETDFPPSRYALRLHQPGYMRPEYISSELKWLSALRDAEIDVPTPFRNLEGDWLTVVDGGYDTPSKRNCTLLSWVEGRELGKNVKPKHYKSLGHVIGKMQEQSMKWKKPKGFKRPHWDWEGLFGDGFDYGFSAQEARESIPKGHKEVFDSALNLVREVTEQLGKRKKTYGLIHADLGNTVYHAGKARPFDFDDCGFSYWMFDLGVVLADNMRDYDITSPRMRTALIEGYQETSVLPESNLDYLDHFIAARLAQLMFFYQGMALRFPQHHNESLGEIDLSAKYLKHILKKIVTR